MAGFELEDQNLLRIIANVKTIQALCLSCQTDSLMLLQATATVQL